MNAFGLVFYRAGHTLSCRSCPQRRLLRMALLVAFMAVRGAASGQLPAGPPLREDFFHAGYTLALPPLSDAEGRAGFSSPTAAAAGSSAWWVCWRENLPLRNGYTSERLMAQRLPEAGALPVDAVFWPGAGEAVELDRIVRHEFAQVLSAPVMAGGDAGAWVLWHRDATVQVRWLSASGGVQAFDFSLPVAGVLRLGARLAGSGTQVWVVIPDAAGAGEARGFALTAEPAGVRLAGSFSFQHPAAADLKLTAGNGQCMVSWARDTGAAGMTVNAAGLTSPQKTLDLPPGAEWLGTVADAGSGRGVWALPLPPAAVRSLFSRPLAADGTWQAGGTVESLGALASLPHLQPGRDGAMFILSGGEAYTWQPGGPLLAWTAWPGIAAYSFAPHGWASDGRRVLHVTVGVPWSVRSYPSNVSAVNVQRADPSPTPSLGTVQLTAGSGRADAPSVAWSARGATAIAQLSGYRNSFQNGSNILTLHGLEAGAAPALYTDGPCSSPAHVWLDAGRLLVVFRRENYLTPEADPDDVLGVFFQLQANGTLAQEGAAFVIGGGPGSQRGVKINRVGDRALVVWREVLPGTTPVYAIRAAFITAGGAVQPPGGTLVDVSVGELAAVAAVENGYIVWRAPQSLVYGSRTAIRYGAMLSDYFRHSGTVSLPDHDATAPSMAGGTMAWRDRVTKRIYFGVIHGGASAVAVSPAGSTAREPAVAALPAGRRLICWLEERPFGLTRVWMAVAAWPGVSEPRLLAEGYFDQETLAASGDGQGRVAVAVTDFGPGGGARVFIVAPDVSRSGGLDIAPGPGGVHVSWDVSSVFPGRQDILESSTDLTHWQPLPALPPAAASGRYSITLPVSPGVPRRSYRLRASQADGVLLP
jgi:hypothetical protein